MSRFLIHWRWRRLLNSSASHNDSAKLELPRVWQPSDNSGSPPIGEGKEAKHGVSYGDTLFTKIYGSYKESVGF
jgi:hypothetical protein